MLDGRKACIHEPSESGVGTALSAPALVVVTSDKMLRPVETGDNAFEFTETSQEEVTKAVYNVTFIDMTVP